MCQVWDAETSRILLDLSQPPYNMLAKGAS